MVAINKHPLVLAAIIDGHILYVSNLGTRLRTIELLLRQIFDDRCCCPDVIDCRASLFG
jgi:hypothetical protein